MNPKLENIFISTYTFIYEGIRPNNSGPIIPLINFFKSKAKKIYALEQPLPGSDYLDTQLTVFENGAQVETLKKNFFFSRLNGRRLSSNKTYISLKLRDIFSNFYFMFKKYGEFNGKKVDLFIGLECVNAIFGIFMKKIGLAKTVVYYVFDWAPDRYSNPVMNWIYIWLDKIATYHSDYTWNITYAIGDGRKKILGYNLNRMSPQLYVPYSCDFDESKILQDDQIDTELIIFSGSLIDENGPLLLLQAFRIVLDKYPSVRLMLIGRGEQEQELRDYVARFKMKNNVEFAGYISDEEKVIELQCKGAIGAAPYPSVKGTRKAFGDVIKIRMYFISGLVTVTTPVPPVKKEIIEEDLGIVTPDDSPEEFARGLLKLLSDKDMLLRFRNNVIKKAKNSNWENNYLKALHYMGFNI